MKTSDTVTIIFVFFIVIGLVIILTAPSRNLTSELSKDNLLKKIAAVDDGEVSGKKAPELQGISGYINTNSEEIKLRDFIGKKVILIDFWTYTCINCIRTLPYLKQWDEKYRSEGLQIIGVHTPEFEFEKNYDNVKKAVEQNELKYPIVQDNDYLTWRAYENHYWPAKYLIDKNGNIVYMHFGEGAYEQTEAKIQELLADIKDSPVKKEISMPSEVETVQYQGIGTPELYFGYKFKRSPLGNEPVFMNAGESYDFNYNYDSAASTSLSPNRPYLEGKWKNNEDNFELVNDNGRIILYYKAKNVNIVAGSAGNTASGKNSSKIIVSVDGKNPRELAIRGFDIYRIVEGKDYEPHVLELDISGRGFMIYTFTFG